MRKISILLFFALFCTVCHAQINKNGVPFTTYYTNYTSQTLDIAQDERGIMYFANDDGIVEFDGSNWNIVREMYARSVAVDADNVVHVGLMGDFGYLYPNDFGTLEFVSLAPSLPDSIQIDDVYKTYCSGTKTYYCSSKYIFVAEKDSVENIVELPEDSFWSYMLNDTLLVSNLTNNAALLCNDTLFPSNLNFKGDVDGGLYGAVTIKNGHNIFTTSTELYEGSLKSKKPKNLLSGNKFLSHFYKKHMPYNMTKFGDSLVISSVYGGVYTILILDNDYNPVIALNNKNGLKSVNALSNYTTGHILWNGMENSISKTDLGNVLRQFNQSSGLNGCIKKALKIDGKLYVGTSVGLFVQETDDNLLPYFKKIHGYGTNDILDFKIPNSNKTITLTFGDVSIDAIVKGERKELAKYSSCECAVQSKKNPNLLYVGTYSNLLCFEYKGGSNPIRLAYEALNGIDIQSIAEDGNGDVWCTSMNSGIIKISDNGKTFRIYDETNGLPETDLSLVQQLDDKVLFLTDAGVYEFNEETSTFVPTQYLNGALSDTTCGVWEIVPYKDGYMVSMYNNDGQYWIKHLVKDGNGGYKEAVGKPFNKIKISNNCYLYRDDNDLLWFFDDETLYCYDPSIVNTATPYYLAPFKSLIRQVSLNDSIVLFGGAFKAENGWGIAQEQPKNIEFELPYKYNSLTFNYSATFYDEENNTEYSTMLEGDDKAWSKWKKSTEYSRRDLSEGNYTFKVKARNIYGIESSVAEFTFSIKPPFYRTIVAYLLYVILLIGFIYIIVKWNTRRLIEEKKKLEQKIAEATEEIRGQNVQLEQQKDEIEKQKDEIQSSINYARRIQRALLTPDEVIDKIFPDHFLLYKPRNVVSGDYYWFGQFGDNKVSIVADCTGHGVPGGFMSMLGMTNLNYIVGKELRPDEILNKLRNAIITSLRQKDDTPAPTGDEKADRRAAFVAATEKKDRSQDGMDVAMYVINEKEMTLSFAGANNPLVLIRDGEVQVIKASKMPVGIYAKLDPFERVDMELKKGDCLYTFSDGFQDQFGYESGKKFMSKHLREVLLEIHQKPMAEQKEILNKTYEDWRGPADHQTDDVVLMGVRIN